MAEKFQNTFRIPSARAPWWDYSTNAAYFVTICVQNKTPHFGQVENNQVVLSELGHHADACWRDIPNHFPFVLLDAFIVMPDHVHGIIIINKSSSPLETQNLASLPPARHASSAPPANRFGPQSRNLASIVRGYKVGVTKQARAIQPDFKWQSRYYDHIIRNDADYCSIVHYIRNSPANWPQQNPGW